MIENKTNPIKLKNVAWSVFVGRHGNKFGKFEGYKGC